MKLTLKRIFKGDWYTIGKLYINGVYFCDTLEDTVRILNSKEDKVAGSTAIPEGTYKVILSYSPKFKRELPLLLDVPFFTGIRIHKGNDNNDSSGCILLGENKVKGKVLNSSKYEEEIVQLMRNENEITIVIN